jgi:hypothetical protein
MRFCVEVGRIFSDLLRDGWWPSTHRKLFSAAPEAAHRQRTGHLFSLAAGAASLYRRRDDRKRGNLIFFSGATKRVTFASIRKGRPQEEGPATGCITKNTCLMKKFVFIITILSVALILSGSRTVQEPECICGAANPVGNPVAEELTLESIQKDFPYKIGYIQKMILYVASEKYLIPKPDWPGFEMNRLFENESRFIIRFQPEYEWDWTAWPITDFAYEEGYEYVIEVLCIDYYRRDDVLYRTFKCCRILSKQKKQSENLPL